MKNISEYGLPHRVHYHIDGHNGYHGSEHEPHVHIRGVECDVKYSIRTGRYMEGKFGSASEKEIERWVNDHLYELEREWDEADDPMGGR